MTATKNERTLAYHFERTLNEILSKNALSLPEQGLAVAYSGGLDSSVLLALANQFCQKHKIPLFAFHVHHGLSINADAWLKHCASVCALSGVTFAGVKVIVDQQSKDGIESSAREARYKALGALCQERQLPIILTAHHQDDQAETVLLQLLRGSGVAGLSGMDLSNKAPKLLGSDTVMLARPLLGVTRQSLLDYSDEATIAYVDDESNADQRYARNALRHQVMSVLSVISPGYTERLARSASHAQSTNRLLTELARQDRSVCEIDGALDISLLRNYSIDRIDNLLRFWLGEQGVCMPTTARLTEMRHQLFDGRDDAKISVFHDTLGIHRYKNKIYASPKDVVKGSEITPIQFSWNGEPSIPFLSYGGTLYFEECSSGVDLIWLKQQVLTIHPRQGGERLKLAFNRPTRDIKSHYQTLKIPFWQRERLPFISAGSKLLFAAGVGMESAFFTDDANVKICIKWESDAN
ncbi:tRNA(Ile)-lysidine synthase [Undibacterium sp. GrIS 1.2]|uniref:tRNA lysidine(34) synthetase TilS n=1 Tax=Undibacterium sp. GrIS 1.2 TaxID=3143933 RepID=UPI0033992F54